MKRQGMKFLIILLPGVFLDQMTKYMAVMNLKSQPSFSIIRNILELIYVENTGSAWGMLSGMRIVLIAVTVVLTGMIIHTYMHLPTEPRFSAARTLLSVLCAGAIGNLIDRIWHGYVIDFIYIAAIHFPVFNIADCYVTVSIVFILLLYRKEIRAWMKNG